MSSKTACSAWFRKPARQSLLAPAPLVAWELWERSRGCCRGSCVPAHGSAAPLAERGELWPRQQGCRWQATSAGSSAPSSPQEPAGFWGLSSFPPAGGGSPSSPGAHRGSGAAAPRTWLLGRLWDLVQLPNNRVLGSQHTKLTCSNSHFCLE